jgi:hypothetical protein
MGAMGGTEVSTPIPSLTGLISVWKMGEFSDGSTTVTRNDSYGTNHLTDAAGKASSVEDGIFGRAVRIGSDGNEALTVADNASLEIDADITALVWTRRTGNMVAGSGIMGKYNASSISSSSFIISINAATTCRAAAAVGSTATVLGSSFTLTLNQWHLLCFRKSASSAPFTLSIDAGSPVASATIAALNQGNTSFAFGVQTNSAFSKNIDICRAVLVKRLWTDTEVTAYYNGGVGIAWP